MHKNLMNKLQELHVCNDLFIDLIEKSPNMIVVLNQDMQLYYCNEHAKNAFDPSLTKEEIYALPLEKMIGMNKKQIKEVFEAMTMNDEWHGDLELHRWSGKMWGTFYIFKRISPYDGSIQWVMYMRDITRSKEKENLMYERINFDHATLLPNINPLTDTLSHINHLTAVFPDKRYALITVQTHSLAYIQDIYGEIVVAELLKMVTDCLSGLKSRNDSLFYTSHGEFSFLADRNSVDEINEFAMTVMSHLESSFRISNFDIYLNANVGVAIYPDTCENAANLLKYARAALKTIRNSSISNVVHFDEQMMDNIVRQTAINQLLHTATDRQEMSLRFHPKYDAITKRVSGAEVLLRWKSPKLGDVSPGEFISVAEEYGHIGNLTKWVFRETCRQAEEWKRIGMGDVRLAVNISALQLFDPQFIDELVAIAHEEEHPLEMVDIEITETTLMKNISRAVTAMDKLRSLNMEIAIDDFGTGYSSLAYLSKLPLHYIKIDRSFIINTPEDTKNTSLVNAIISMCKSLGLRTIAEGVETAAQYDYLLDSGCDLIQGFYFAQPLTASEFTELMMEEAG